MEEFESWQKKNIIKLRDFKLPTPVDHAKEDDYRDQIEPWLTALFQSEHLSLLTGAGISTAVHFLATGKSGADMGGMDISVFKDQVAKHSAESAKKAGRGIPNIEDEIRTINELIRGLEIYNSTIIDFELDLDIDTLKSELENGIIKFADAVLDAERNITSGSN